MNHVHDVGLVRGPRQQVGRAEGVGFDLFVGRQYKHHLEFA
jgi:hypothetical protein